MGFPGEESVVDVGGAGVVGVVFVVLVDVVLSGVERSSQMVQVC